MQIRLAFNLAWRISVRKSKRRLGPRHAPKASFFQGVKNLFSQRESAENFQTQSRPLLGATLGIAMSLVPLILVLEVADGMIMGITNRIIETYSYHIRVLPIGRSKSYSDLELMKAELEQVKEVEYATIEQNGVGLILFNGKRSLIQVRALAADIYEQDSGFQEFIDISSGNFDLSENSILLGQELVRMLGVKVGDEIVILTGALVGDSQRLIPKNSKFIVRGIFTSGYSELDKYWAFISSNTARAFLHPSVSSNFIGLKVADPYNNIAGLENKISANVYKNGFFTKNWMEISSSQRQQFNLSRAILIFIMALIVVVATINVASSMSMLVMENGTEIAIMKAMGSPPSLLLTTYLIVAFFSALSAIIIGISVGVILALNVNGIINFLNLLVNFLVGLFSATPKLPSIDLLSNQYYLEYIPINIKIAPLLFIALGTIILTIVSALLPAFQALRLHPLEVLRKNRS